MVFINGGHVIVYLVLTSRVWNFTPLTCELILHVVRLVVLLVDRTERRTSERQTRRKTA